MASNDNAKIVGWAYAVLDYELAREDVLSIDSVPSWILFRTSGEAMKAAVDEVTEDAREILKAPESSGFSPAEVGELAVWVEAMERPQPWRSIQCETDRFKGLSYYELDLSEEEGKSLMVYPVAWA